MKKNQNIKRISFYLSGLTLTCFGVVFILNSGFGIDAWNTVFSRMAEITPLSIGTWSIIIQSSFWLITCILEKKINWDCIFPIFWKGVALDFAKAIVLLPISPSLIVNISNFLFGYLLIGIGTGTYLITNYPRMPIDGLMMAFTPFFSNNINRARLFIEATGFILILLTKGLFGLGTVLITLTVGHVVSTAKHFASLIYQKERKTKCR